MGPQAVFARSAQRLSASTEGTRRGTARPGKAWLGCSTPFGINGRNATAGPVAVAVVVFVLNAFRHQRKERALAAVWLSQVNLRAQRLSASTEGTRGGRARRQRPSARCSTPFGINGRNAAPVPTPCSLPSYRATIQAPGDTDRKSGRGAEKTVRNATAHIAKRLAAEQVAPQRDEGQAPFPRRERGITDWRQDVRSRVSPVASTTERCMIGLSDDFERWRRPAPTRLVPVECSGTRAAEWLHKGITRRSSTSSMICPNCQWRRSSIRTSSRHRKTLYCSRVP